ncbi:hypothetical protein MCOR02_004434 [Pyricularia oryzae]|nr:hypothetical protein MCOR02_004434 [Pyricularia oryzae]
MGGRCGCQLVGVATSLCSKTLLTQFDISRSRRSTTQQAIALNSATYGPT